LGYIPISSKIQDDIVPYVRIRASCPKLRLIYVQLPFWALVSFGAFLLFKLGYGVLTFNDVPEAHKELMAQIEQAKKELRAKGVDVD
jgi:dolichyl-phosphate mannosyltransferase polypeptide 3